MAAQTICEFFDTDVVELFNLLHDELCFIYLHDKGGTTLAAPCKAKFTKRIFQRLWNIDGLRLLMRCYHQIYWLIMERRTMRGWTLKVVG